MSVRKKSLQVTCICHTCGASFLRSRDKIRTKYTFCSKACIDYRLGTRRKRPFEWLYNKLVFQAKKRGIALTLSYEHYLALTLIADCHYCGASIPWEPYRTNFLRSTGYHLDRKDVAAGYTFTNVVVCCTRCNHSRSDNFSYGEWKQIGEVIRGFSN